MHGVCGCRLPQVFPLLVAAVERGTRFGWEGAPVLRRDDDTDNARGRLGCDAA